MRHGWVDGSLILFPSGASPPIIPRPILSDLVADVHSCFSFCRQGESTPLNALNPPKTAWQPGARPQNPPAETSANYPSSQRNHCELLNCCSFAIFAFPRAIPVSTLSTGKLHCLLSSTPSSSRHPTTGRAYLSRWTAGVPPRLAQTPRALCDDG